MLGTHVLYRGRALLLSEFSLFKAVDPLPSSQTHICYASFCVCRAMPCSFSSSSVPFLSTNTDYSQTVGRERSEEFPLKEAVQANGRSLNPSILAGLLRTCMENTDLQHGRLTHMLIIMCGFDTLRFLQFWLLQMYCQCAASEDSFDLFFTMPHDDVASWDGFAIALISKGQVQEACFVYHRMQEEGVPPTRTTCMLLLPALSGHKSMLQGKQIHTFGLEIGCGSDVAVGTALVNMYSKCGSLTDSKQVFNAMPIRNVVTWTTMISVCAQHREGLEAFRIFEKMPEERVSPDKVTFVNVLAACSGHLLLSEGQNVHALVLCYGFEQSINITNALIHLYGRCEMLEEARQVFESAHEKDTISFSSLSFAYASHGNFNKALSLFNQMEVAMLCPNKVAFLSVLSVLACQEACPAGEDIHNRILQKGLDGDVILCNALINMYHKCGCTESARRIFAKMCHRNVVSWTSLIGILGLGGEFHKVLLAFESMQEEGISPNKVTFLSMLGSCANELAHAEGRILHACIVDSGIETDCAVGTGLITLYGSCHSTEDAQVVFDHIVVPDILMWNNLLSVYVDHNHGCKVFYLFDRMLSRGFLPDNSSYGFLLVACSKEGSLSFGKQVHVQAQCMECEMNVVTATNMLNMYGKCGSPYSSLCLFDKMSVKNTITWTAMISLFTENKLEDTALQFYEQMLQESSLPNMVTMINMATLCAIQMALAGGKRFHASIIYSDFRSETSLANALIGMYGRCDSLKHAQQTFDSLHTKNVISWSGIIAAYAQHSSGMAALRLFEEMQLLGVTPNDITLVSVLDACANEACLTAGECIHIFLLNNRFEFSALVGNPLINMYNKCGDVQAAVKTFATITERDLASWSTLMGAYAEHGRGKEAVQLMEQMMLERFSPDEACITNFLSACSHCGQLDDGWYCFSLIVQLACITPDHFACVIDLFGRARLLPTAEVLINHMSMQPTVMSFMALLSACRYESDISRSSELLTEHVLELDAKNTAPYHMLNHISSLIDDGAKARLLLLNDAR